MTNAKTDIRALSIRQPWAWAICAGLKRTENRSWSTNYRGTIAIHASLSTQGLNELRPSFDRVDDQHPVRVTGAIIGLADLVDVASYGPQHEQDPFAFGPFCWTFTNARLLSEPIPLKGKLNLFKLERQQLHQLEQASTYQVDMNAEAGGGELAQLITPEVDPVECYEALFEESVATGLHQEALSTCGQRLIELAPDRASGYMILGAHRLSEPDSQDCVDLLQRATELAPEHALSWYFLTDAHLKSDQHEAALQAAEQAMKLMPDNAMAYENRGRVHFFAERFLQARDDLSVAIQKQPNDAGSLAMRAECHARLGDTAAALSDIQAALELMPDEPSLLALQSELQQDAH